MCELIKTHEKENICVEFGSIRIPDITDSNNAVYYNLAD